MTTREFREETSKGIVLLVLIGSLAYLLDLWYITRWLPDWADSDCMSARTPSGTLLAGVRQVEEICLVLVAVSLLRVWLLIARRGLLITFGQALLVVGLAGAIVLFRVAGSFDNLMLYAPGSYGSWRVVQINYLAAMLNVLMGGTEISFLFVRRWQRRKQLVTG
ncbi:MAG: hypothetical protein ACREDR_17305 [Blastocatellia bacterium]